MTICRSCHDCGAFDKDALLTLQWLKPENVWGYLCLDTCAKTHNLGQPKTEWITPWVME